MMLLLCSDNYIWHLYCIPRMEYFTSVYYVFAYNSSAISNISWLLLP